MGTEQAIYQDFDDFNVDNNKANIDDEVKNGGRQALKHLLLPEGDQQRFVKPFIDVATHIPVAPDQDIGSNLPDLPREQAEARYRDQQEEDVLDGEVHGKG